MYIVYMFTYLLEKDLETNLEANLEANIEETRCPFLYSLNQSKFYLPSMDSLFPILLG